MRESTIEKSVCDWARQNGILVMKLSGMNQKGQPDRMFIKDGKVMFVEFKAPGKLPTNLQRRFLLNLAEQGMHAGWCDNVHDGKRLLAQALLTNQ